MFNYKLRNSRNWSSCFCKVNLTILINHYFIDFNSIGLISVYANLKIQEMNEKQINKYKKAKNQIRNKYTLNSTPDDYIKLACLLHLANSEAR